MSKVKRQGHVVKQFSLNSNGMPRYMDTLILTTFKDASQKYNFFVNDRKCTQIFKNPAQHMSGFQNAAFFLALSDQKYKIYSPFEVPHVVPVVHT